MTKKSLDIYDKIIEAFKKMLLLGVGFSLLVVGIAGLVLPFLPGIVLVFIGLTFSAKGSQSIAKSEHVIKALKFLGHKIVKTKSILTKVFSYVLKKDRPTSQVIVNKRNSLRKTILKTKVSLK
jgi:hypothetical protein